MKKKVIIGTIAIIVVVSVGTTLAVSNNLDIYRNKQHQTFEYSLKGEYKNRDEVLSEMNKLNNEYKAYLNTVSDRVTESNGIVSRKADAKEDLDYQTKMQTLEKELNQYPSLIVSQSDAEALEDKVMFWDGYYHDILRTYGNDLQELQHNNPECIDFYNRSQALYQQYKDGKITARKALDEIKTFRFSDSVWRTKPVASGS